MDEASLILSFTHKMGVVMYKCLDIHDVYINYPTRKHTFMYSYVNVSLYIYVHVYICTYTHIYI